MEVMAFMSFRKARAKSSFDQIYMKWIKKKD